MTTPACEMSNACAEAVTHIGDKGYVYCKTHATQRRLSGYERTRAMRVWEVRLIESGEPLPSYQPTRKPQN